MKPGRQESLHAANMGASMIPAFAALQCCHKEGMHVATSFSESSP